MDSQADFQGDTLADLFRKIWQAKRAVMAGCLIGALLGTGLSLILQPHYEARMIVGPVAAGDSNEVLASFEAGRAMDHRETSLSHVPAEFIRFEQVVRETTVATILAKYEGILDQVGQDRLFRLMPERAVPAAGLADYLSRHIKIEPIGTTASRRITYSHPDPDFAVRVLKHLHKIADETIRQKSGADTEERISWLQKEIHQAANPDHRQALASLLMAQERRRMLVVMDQPYAAELIEPPAAGAKPAWPSMPLVVAALILLGGMAGFFISLCRRERAS